MAKRDKTVTVDIFGDGDSRDVAQEIRDIPDRD
jgi:hypothetical protein